jgi:hypothetical protein
MVQKTIIDKLEEVSYEYSIMTNFFHKSLDKKLCGL